MNLNRSAGLALAYDTSRLELVGVRRGRLTHDFDLFADHVDVEAGTLRVGLGRSTGPISDRGRGSVLLLTFRVRPHAPAGQAILHLRHDVSGMVTQLNEGSLDLNPDPSDSAGDVLDRLVTVRPSKRRGGGAFRK